MISRYAYHGLTWIDLESPSREEMLHIGEEFGLSKLVEEELFAQHAPATIDLYDSYIYATLLCPTANDAGTAVTNARLVAIVGKKYLITARQEKIEGLYSFASQFEHVEKLDQSKKVLDGNMLFTEMLKHVYATAHKDLANITHRIKTLEHSLYTANEERMVRAIFNAKLAALSFREGIAAHEGLLKAYTAASAMFFGENDGRTISITSEHAAICNAIDAQYHILCAMQETHAVLLATRANARLKILITLAFITLLAAIVLKFI
jgi:Mg2+ and Co2+ transporter CorA